MTGEGRTPDQGGSGGTDALNVVRFPGDWFGPLDELVPLDSVLRAADTAQRPGPRKGHRRQRTPRVSTAAPSRAETSAVAATPLGPAPAPSAQTDAPAPPSGADAFWGGDVDATAPLAVPGPALRSDGRAGSRRKRTHMARPAAIVALLLVAGALVLVITSLPGGRRGDRIAGTGARTPALNAQSYELHPAGGVAAALTSTPGTDAGGAAPARTSSHGARRQGTHHTGGLAATRRHVSQPAGSQPVEPETRTVPVVSAIPPLRSAPPSRPRTVAPCTTSPATGGCLP